MKVQLVTINTSILHRITIVGDGGVEQSTARLSISKGE